MSVLIKNMEIPKACVYRENGYLIFCPLYDMDGYCGALNKEASHKEGSILPDCPIVPVVLCKDCKHSDTFPVCGEPYSFPLKCLSIRYGGVFEDWFCEHGERR